MVKYQYMTCGRFFVQYKVLAPIGNLIGYASVRPSLHFDRSTSTSLLRTPYFDSRTSTFVKIWISYWPRTIGRSKVSVEVKLWQKGRSKVLSAVCQIEYMHISLGTWWTYRIRPNKFSAKKYFTHNNHECKLNSAEFCLIFFRENNSKYVPY